MRGFFTHFQATFYLYLFCTGGIFFANANNNPFPTTGNYNVHVKPSNYTAAALTTHASDFYDLWKNEYLKSDCGDYYVWVKDNKKAVSEARGYGMMLTAYFAGHDANAKSYFDGLYNYFRKNRSITSPDLMDWEQKTCNDAASSNDGDYYYNACRNAWRLGVDYLLNGETKALNAVKKLNTWLATSNTNDASKISNGYKLDGTELNTFNDATFVGPLTVGGMLDSSRQNCLNSLYSTLYCTSNLSGNYYADTIKLLSLLSISGNYWAPPKEKIQPTQATTGPTHGKYVVGYYAQWAIYGRKYLVSDIDASKLTHLMYAFMDTKYDATTQTASIETLDKFADFDHTRDPGITHSTALKGNFGALKLLKENNPHLNILVSLGGWTKSQAFPALAASENGRKTLAQAMVSFINQHPFIDGFDIDWEFPVEGGTDGTEMVNGGNIPAQPHTPNDHKNLVFLLKEMRKQFDAAFPNEHKWVTMAGGNNVGNLLSTHVGPRNETAHGMTENIATYSDFITFFGYDFGGNWFDKTCYNAPLYPSNNPEDPLYRTQKDPMYTGSGIPQQALDDLVTLYLDHLGIPKEKLVMGVPFYGRLFEQVVDGTVATGLPGLFRSAPRWSKGSCNGPRPPKGSWDPLPCEQSGSIAFCDISQGVSLTTQQSHKILDANDLSKVSSTAASNGWIRYWDNTAKVPYVYNTQTKQFITYDDPESIAVKINYMKSKDLGGAMIWELSEDTRASFGIQTFSNPTVLLSQIDSSFSDINVDVTVVFRTPQRIAISGVKAELLDENGAVLQTQNSNISGKAVFSQIQGIKNYTIRFSKSSYAFLPAEITIDALDLMTNKSYDVMGSSNLITFSGTTTLNGTLGSTDVVLYDDKQNELKRVQSNSADGKFSISNVIGGGNYVLTAEKAYHTFNSFSYTNQITNVSSIGLVGNVSKHTISGTVKDSNGMGLSGVTLTLSGGANGHTTSNAQGNYMFTNVEAGKNYTLTPSKTGLNFEPVSKQFSPLENNETVDFQKDEGFVFGYVKDGGTPISGVTAELVLNWVSNSLPYVTATATTGSDGKYVFDNEFSHMGTVYKISDYAAVNGSGKLQLQLWTTGGRTFKPASYDFSAGQIPSQPKRFDFNTQLPAPVITITSPNANPTTIGVGANVTLEATIEIQPQDSSISISSVRFDINGRVFTPGSSGNTYSATWAPTHTDFDNMHSFKVTATSSNNETSTETYDFRLECSGGGCPNRKPLITWVSPSSTTVNQPNSFAAIPVEVTATDADGSVQSVTVSVDGGSAQQMTVGTNNTYTFSFTPWAYKKYTLQIRATDNTGDSTTFSQEIDVTNSTFVSLPNSVNVGYYHSWDNASAPFIYLKDVIGTKYNVVVYSFIETQNGDGYTPKLTINDKAANYLTGGVFDKAKLKADIKALQDAGIPVIVSIGGQNGHVELSTTSEKDTFVNGVVAILNDYGFDGLDIDFEGSSMNFGAGALTDFSYTSVSKYPKLKNVIDAIKEIDTKMGDGFHITAAPEVQYVQQGTTAFTNNWGSFLAVMDNIRDILDYIHVQLYNIGATNGVKGLDGNNYYQGTPDLIVSACESLIRGFKTAGPAIQFNGLRADQVAIGLPSTDTCSGAGGAAGGGFVKTSDVEKAIRYLTQGTSFGGSYTLQGGPYPKLRGAMTWSINWDKSTACGSTSYEYANNIDHVFNEIPLSNKEVQAHTYPILYPNPTEDILTIQWIFEGEVDVIFTDALGRQLIKTTHHFGAEPKLQFSTINLPSGVLFLELKTTNGNSYVRRVIVK